MSNPATPRLPGQRAGLDRSQVLAAAFELVARAGVEGLTMRALAAQLGVSPNALYSHVADKDALVDAVLDELLAQVEAPTSTGGDPIEGLFDLMASTYHVLVGHPDLVSLYLARQGARGPNAQHLGQVMLALLRRAGATGPAAETALKVLVIHTIGFAAFTTANPLDADDPAFRATPDTASFHRSLRWLLAGIAT